MVTGRCYGPEQINVGGMKSIHGRACGLKLGLGVAVDLGSLARKVRADPLFNIFSHAWPHRSHFFSM